MKPIIALVILLYCSTTFSLKCLECSEKSDVEDAKKCSVNSTNYRESADGKPYCRLWSIGDVAVHRSLVSEAECTEAKLKQNVDNNIKGTFPGEGNKYQQSELKNSLPSNSNTDVD